jgi:hypothetical protein
MYNVQNVHTENTVYIQYSPPPPQENHLFRLPFPQAKWHPRIYPLLTISFTCWYRVGQQIKYYIKY